MLKNRHGLYSSPDGKTVVYVYSSYPGIYESTTYIKFYLVLPQQDKPKPLYRTEQEFLGQYPAKIVACKVEKGVIKNQISVTVGGIYSSEKGEVVLVTFIVDPKGNVYFKTLLPRYKSKEASLHVAEFRNRYPIRITECVVEQGEDQ